MVDIIHHDKQQECDICHGFFDKVWEMDIEDIKNYCINCLAHRFGTQEALYFLKHKGEGKHW